LAGLPYKAQTEAVIELMVAEAVKTSVICRNWQKKMCLCHLVAVGVVLGTT
jgi:hypothetical protein